MSEFVNKNKKWIAAAAAVVIAACVLIWKQTGAGSSDGAFAYVETVKNLTGQNASLGMINRFAGIVEPQGTWSVNKNSDVEIEEIYVSEGDEVEEGQALFVYSTTKYEEDLQQANIDLERLHNEYDSTVETIAQLEKEKRDASSSEQANYTVQIKEQNLSLKDKDLDIQMKEAEIEKLESNIENAEVKSGISGVVKSINEERTVPWWVVVLIIILIMAIIGAVVESDSDGSSSSSSDGGFFSSSSSGGSFGGGFSGGGGAGR